MNDPKIRDISFSGLVQDVGADACKVMPPGSRHRYKMAITYHIEGKPDEQGIVRHKTRKGLQQRIVDLTNYAAQGRLFAWYDSVNGGFCGTKLVF